MSKTDHATKYVTPEEAKATRIMHAKQRKARALFARVKKNALSMTDFDAWTAAEAEAVESFNRFKSVIGGEA